MSLLKTWEALTLLLSRCGLATVFIYHGYPKLFGSTERFVESFQTLGLSAYFVYVVGAIEFFGGVALALGLFTRVAGLLEVWLPFATPLDPEVVSQAPRPRSPGSGYCSVPRPARQYRPA